MKAFNKIFGVGAQKTGVTSLSEALNLIGVACTTWPWQRHLELRSKLQGGVHNLDFISEFDAVTDLPIPCIYRELDQLYPGSKFILTVRNPEEWVQSVRRHLIATDEDFSRAGMNYIWEEFLFYQQWEFSKAGAISRFHEHNQEVRKYFLYRPEDFLEFDIAAEDQWEKLCGFLDVYVPLEKFPWSNQS